MRFRRITIAAIDPTRVTLKLILCDDGTIVGRVLTLAIDEAGETEMMSTATADPPIADALQLACHLAEFKEQEVDVLDPDHLWHPSYGDLK